MPQQSAPVKGAKSPFKFVLPNIFKIATILILFTPDHAACQAVSSCVNADFESGDFTNWKGQTGSCCPVLTTPSAIIPGRHTIMSGSGTDPNTCNTVSVVASGGQYSARIGNAEVGAEAEKLSYAITVSPASALFIYKYAVVLEDPGHPADEQPRFQIRVLNDSGNLIDPLCGEYTVVASSDLPGFHTCNGTIVYKDWTTVGLDLSAYMGKTLTIEFMTGDCTPGGHFGYAYIDAYCSALQIGSTYCSGAASAVLSAPVGFAYLWNTGETTQSIQIDNPLNGQVYNCRLTSVTGCVVNISTALASVDPVASFDITNTCFNNAAFSNTSLNPGNVVIDQFLWDFGDGTTSHEPNPKHTFPTAGAYHVSLSVSNGMGCTSSASRNMTVYPAPTAVISYPGSPYCNATLTSVPVVLSGTEAFTGGQFSSAPGLNLDATTGAIMPHGSLPGTYTVSYAIPPTTDNCKVMPITTTVAITANPTVSVRYPQPDYCLSVTAAVPVLSGTNAYTGGYYSSDDGLSIDAITGTVNPSKSTSGIHTVTYHTPANSGCESVSESTILTINKLPEPHLEDGMICVDALGNTFRTYTLDTGLNDTAYNFEWFLDGILIASQTKSTYQATVAGSYSVVATNAITGCQSEEVFATVNKYITPDNFISYLDANFTDHTTLTLIVEGGTGPYFFSIDDGPFDHANVYTQLSPGTHTIKVTDAGNCTDIAKEILILDYPKFFTPNDDGYHDTWNISRLSEQQDAVIYIYDRYGKLLKQIKASGEGWDGTYNGRNMPSEDYWFVVDYREMDVKGVLVRKKYKSHFSIKR